jgi:hypothetical protein
MAARQAPGASARAVLFLALFALAGVHFPGLIGGSAINPTARLRQ